MSELDKTKDNIGVDKLDKDSREKLFKDFQKAGGKVLTERELLRQRVKEQLLKQKQTKPSTNQMPPPKIQPKPQHKQKLSSVEKPRPSTTQKSSDILEISWIDRIKVFINAYFNSTIKINGYLKHRFFNDTLVEVPRSFTDLRIVSYLLTEKDERLSNLVKKSLNAINPVGYEVIYRLNSLPNNEIFHKAESIIKVYSQTKVTVKPQDIKDIIKYIFKKLYILYPYKDQAKVLISTALRSIQQYLPKGDLQRTEKLFYKAWDFLFSDYFQKLKVVIDFIIGKELSLTSEHLIRFLEISEDDHIGYLTEKFGISKVEEDKPKTEDKSSPQKVKDEKQVYLEEGVEIINSIDIKKIQESIRRKNVFVENNDKVFITEAILEFYDTHIHPVLVTKAKYSLVFDAVKTLDVKKEFDDIYTGIVSIKDRINEYYKVIEDYRNVESDVMVPITKKSNLLNTRSIERTRISYQIRKDVSELFKKIKNNLDIVLKDYKSGGAILTNSDEIIEFKINKIKDIQVEKNFFEGKKVIDALNDIDKIINSIIFLLTDGDLGGSNVKLEKPIYLNINL
ncbi:MAG: hypothetical protein N3D81_04615 [Spirochaetes bacterium]|nr:hypothetical protein [Spirochaetota bacterium]